MSRPSAKKQGSQGTAKMVFQPPHTTQGWGPGSGGALRSACVQGAFGGSEASQGNSTTTPTESLRASGLRNPCKPQGPESAGADLPQWSLSPSVVGGAICEQ